MRGLFKKNSFLAPAEFSSLRSKTLEQIEKDFRLQGIAIEIPRDQIPYSKLVEALAKLLAENGLTSGGKLQSLLYQLDISENYFSEKIDLYGSGQSQLALGDAIVKRCFAKVVFRKKNS